MVGLNESLQNLTSAVVQTASPTVQQTLGSPPAILQKIGVALHNAISNFFPGKEWLVVLALAGVLAGLVVKKLREGVISLTTLWVSGTLVLYLAFKYVGL